MLISLIAKEIELGQTLISLEFLFFLAAVFITYYSVARRHQWQFLLAASFVFYTLNNRWEFLLLLAGVTGVNFFIGILIQNASHKFIQRLYLWINIGLNTFILLVFKYNHLLGNLFRSYRSDADKINISLLVPLGISYFTFKALSYGVDIYRAKIKCERNLGKFALFMSFFPEISAGPIDRARDFLPQTDPPKVLIEANYISGMQLMLWGYFKKIVIANNLAVYVNPIYSSPKDYSGIALVIATYFLAFQIYADFSGYTDIVRGTGRLFGYSIPENFNSPYLSRSISEFWTRWHITLSTWLRDYLFLPLSFFFSRRIKTSSICFLNSNIVIYLSSALITFIIAGIWHGSAWTFIVWGFLHGLFLSLSNATKPIRKIMRKKFPLYQSYPKLVAFGQMVFCFHLVAFSWIFFRAHSISDAMYIIRNFAPKNIASSMRELFNPIGQLGLEGSKYGFFISILAIIFLILIEIRQRSGEIPEFFISKKRLIRWTVYYILFLSIFLFGEFSMKEFIYIQF